ncbi:MAG: hypothetical protein U5Q16_16350 [Gammaproteobacteria bacterium]|nr:hypothetical protein [Gammaproteobacteria bacterium]
MEQPRGIYHNAVFYFIALLIGVFLGFWPTYFAVFGQAPGHVHFHGLTMLAWCGLLIAQATFIRIGRRDLHRALGKASFLLVPIMALAILSFAQTMLLRDGPQPQRLYILYLQMQLLTAFLLSYGLAIYNRRQPIVHARFMICATLPLIDPFLARVILFYLWEPSNIFHLQLVTYGVTDLILVTLMLSNWRRERRLGVFPLMLPVFMAVQLPNFFVTDWAGWIAFADCFARLPLP